MIAAKDRKIVVPDGMLKAAGRATDGLDPEGYFIYRMLEAALAWLADNPIVPSDDQISDMYSSASEAGISFTLVSRFIAEWQRRMFIAPSPAVPEEISDLLIEDRSSVTVTSDYINSKLVKAFNRGRKLGGQL